jgi:hypothetical protein
MVLPSGTWGQAYSLQASQVGANAELFVHACQGGPGNARELHLLRTNLIRV